MTSKDLKAIEARCEEHLSLVADDKIPLRTQGIYISKFEQACRTDIPTLLDEVERRGSKLDWIKAELQSDNSEGNKLNRISKALEQA